jgi:hypothetical protein
VAGHNVGTCLERTRSGRGCSARASMGDRAVAAQVGLALPHRVISPALPGHRPAFIGGFRVFWGFDSSVCDSARVAESPSRVQRLRPCVLALSTTVTSNR